MRIQNWWSFLPLIYTFTSKTAVPFSFFVSLGRSTPFPALSTGYGARAKWSFSQHRFSADGGQIHTRPATSLVQYVLIFRHGVVKILPIVELEVVPLRECERGQHTFEVGGVKTHTRGRCINPDCKSKTRTICTGCTRDVVGLVWVFPPSAEKRCWEKFHLVRVPYPVDNAGNGVERPRFTKKKKTEQQSWEWTCR